MACFRLFIDPGVFQQSGLICTSDPANVEHILKTNFNNYVKGPHFQSTFVELLGTGIFNADHAANVSSALRDICPLKAANF